MGPRGLVNARGVAATLMAAGRDMRWTTAFSRIHCPAPASHHLTKNGFSLRSLLLKLRAPINPISRLTHAVLKHGPACYSIGECPSLVPSRYDQLVARRLEPEPSTAISQP